MSTTDIPTRRILVVDDEPVVRRSLQLLLGLDGHDVETATASREALARLEQGAFDLVITDFVMPDMQGDELAARIKARRPKQAVGMITAQAEALRFTGNKVPGVDFMIGKPFRREELRAAVAAALAKQDPRTGGADARNSDGPLRHA